MGRLANERIVDPVLTNLAREYQNAALVGTKLLPFVPVDKEAGRVPVFGKDAFRIYNTVRAIRAASNRINPDGLSSVEYVTQEHDLEYPIDYRETNEAAVDIQAYGARVTKNAVMLRLEKMIADTVLNANTYPTGNKITLSGTDQWTDKSNSHPIDVIFAGKDAVRGKIGLYPNVVVFGAAAWRSFREHPDVLDKIKYSMKGILTTDLAAEILEVNAVFVGAAVYEDTDGTFKDVWSDSVVLAYVSEVPAGNRTQYDPSFGYTLRVKGYPFVDKYDEKKKLLIVRYTDNFVPKVLGAEAGYLIADTNA